MGFLHGTWRHWRALSIREQIRWARRVLPPVILMGVVAVQVWIKVVYPSAPGRLGFHLGLELLVYALLGPVMTWFVLFWFERQLAEKERIGRRLRDQERRMLQIRDELSAQIAGDLHDSLGPQLYALGLKAEFAKKRLRDDPATAEAELGLINEALQRSIREVRRAVYALRPLELERANLVDTLRRVAAEYEELNETRTALTVSGRERRLPPDLELAIFHIVQEALYNVRRHARARHVWIDLDLGPPDVRVRVRDDGCGFDPTATPEGVGLRHMRERAAAHGGTVAVHAATGRGTDIVASLPSRDERTSGA